MKPSAKLIYGPANSGKTERCINAYLDLLRERPGPGGLKPGRLNAKALFLVPTKLKVDEVKARITASGRIGGIRNPAIFEFYGLAQRVIGEARQKVCEISPLAKVLIIQEIVRKRKETGGLQYFSPISEFQGFYEMIAAFIGELKAAAVTPEVFAAAVKKRGRKGANEARDAELAAIYADYQDRLRRLELYDREGRLWLARDLLREGHEESVPKLDLLLVDGFPHFSPAELQIVVELANRSQEALITLTFAKGEDAGRHYLAVERTYQLLRESFALTEEPITSGELRRSAGPAWPALRPAGLPGLSPNSSPQVQFKCMRYKHKWVPFKGGRHGRERGLF